MRGLHVSAEQGAFELAPYLCAAHKVCGELLGWGLTRTRTLADTAPVDLVPAAMQEIKADAIWKGRVWVMEFRKPE